MKCLRVNVNGDIDVVEYETQDFLLCRLKNKVILKGDGEFVLLEVIESDDKKWICYGYEEYNDVGFNRFEFAYTNPVGDVIVICMEEELLVDVDREEFVNLYGFEDNLDDFLLRDELDEMYGDRDTGYEYDDFVVRSDDEN